MGQTLAGLRVHLRRRFVVQDRELQRAVLHLLARDCDTDGSPSSARPRRRQRRRRITVVEPGGGTDFEHDHVHLARRRTGARSSIRARIDFGTLPVGMTSPLRVRAAQHRRHALTGVASRSRASRDRRLERVGLHARTPVHDWRRARRRSSTVTFAPTVHGCSIQAMQIASNDPLGPALVSADGRRHGRRHVVTSPTVRRTTSTSARSLAVNRSPAP